MKTKQQLLRIMCHEEDESFSEVNKLTVKVKWLLRFLRAQQEAVTYDSETKKWKC